MIDALGAVGAGDIRALHARYLASLRPLGLVPASRAAGAFPAAAALGLDGYTPSAGGASSAVTYNRFGLLDGAPAALPAVAFSGGTARAAGDPTGLTPAQVARAYAFGGTGLTGAGQTIAVVTALTSPTVAQDLAVFDRTFGLPGANLRILGQSGGAPAGPAADAGWAAETALDLEWAHAVAPGANLLLVEASSTSPGDLAAAVDTARHQPGVSVVSMSFGTTEFPQELRYDSVLTTPPGHTPIAFVAASGDSGAGTYWPAVSPNVLAVGGTTLFTGPGGSYIGELGWPGSGGGISLYETEPAYQLGVQSTRRRTTPDVAYDADPLTGFSIYQGGSWQTVGGTSAGAPQWAGLIALADQQRAGHGLGPLGPVQTSLYRLPAADFHDVVVGSSGFLAAPGYDFVTGLGTPVANRLVNGLAAPVTTTTIRLSISLKPVSIASLLFPWTGAAGGLGWKWGGIDSSFTAVA